MTLTVSYYHYYHAHKGFAALRLHSQSAHDLDASQTAAHPSSRLVQVSTSVYTFYILRRMFVLVHSTLVISTYALEALLDTGARNCVQACL